MAHGDGHAHRLRHTGKIEVLEKRGTAGRIGIVTGTLRITAVFVVMMFAGDPVRHEIDLDSPMSHMNSYTIFFVARQVGVRG